MLNQKLQQKLLQKLSPQQIQVIKLLEIPAISLDQRIKAEIEENPALEVDEDDTPLDEPMDDTSEDSDTDSDTGENEEFETDEHDYELEDFYDEDEYSNYKFAVDNNPANQESREIPFSTGNSFQEILENQLSLYNLTEKQRILATYLIGNIDEDGYLRREIENIVDDIAFKQNVQTSEKELAEVLETIHKLDPAGIGARNLQECLLLQLDRKDQQKSIIAIARAILKDYFTEFTKKHYSKIVEKLNIGEGTLKLAITEIVKLNPKPGGSFSDSSEKADIAQTITPDFYIDETNGELELSLSSRNAPDLKVSPAYIEMLKEYKNSKIKGHGHKEAVTFVKQKIESAKWFIDAMQQRQYTLLFTMQAIVDAQRDFFLTGDETKIKPMILKDIADKIGLDVSTISRVANSKYIQTNFGIYQLKHFFSEGLKNDEGEDVSSREIKQIIKDLINVENKHKPYNDDELAEKLKEKGYHIARRTVAKYRDQLDIPVGRMRKEI